MSNPKKRKKGLNIIYIFYISLNSGFRKTKTNENDRRPTTVFRTYLENQRVSKIVVIFIFFWGLFSSQQYSLQGQPIQGRAVVGRLLCIFEESE